MRISIRRGLRCILFKRRMYHVRVTSLLRSRGVSVTYSCIRMEFLFRMYGVSRRTCMCYVRVTYVWRMKCTCDVSTAYVLPSILICGVSVLYQLLFNAHENKRLCSLDPCYSHITVINYQRSKMPPEKSKLTQKTRGGGEKHVQAPHPVVIHEQRQKLHRT